jgi:site-specific recombinase XerD
MGESRQLTDEALTRKCVVLLMATTAARFTEMEQFKPNDSEPQEQNRTWTFFVRVKNREYKEPIVLHRTQTAEIDPIIAMLELRERIRRKRQSKCYEENTFWYTTQWTVMSTEQIRQAAKDLLQEAQIQDHRPYHIKHATVTCLKKRGVSADQLTKLCRHKMSSSVTMEYYMSDDMGAACSKRLEAAMLENEKDQNLDDQDEECVRNEGKVYGKAPSQSPKRQATKQRFLRSKRK